MPQLREYTGEVWPSALLLFCLVLLAVIKLSAFSKVTRIVQSTFSNQILQQLEREDVNTFRFYSIALNAFFALNLAFLVYKINASLGWVLQGSQHVLQYGFFLLIIAGIILFKAVINWLVALFTGERRIVHDYQINSMLINQTFGLFLFPCVVLMQFSSYYPQLFVWAGLAVTGTSLLIKWYRGLMMSVAEERIGLLQIFSYFCGLEILPVFVLVKYIIETF